ncbi:hypothetical protein Patl1_09274 [Pistacia atlantica]|uniref:Uncharacterized protein n=1 Tax=Pistacia atlantica TaxID=434234 RepID=A0ACC1AFN3_9ROSI|nr:hypothetical protein Patl1_09274 [Pistacia atlantica]
MALLIILVLSLPILLLLLQRHRKSKSVRSPPGPRGLPLIGNIHQFDISNTPRYLWNLSKQYGPLVFLRLGFVSVLVVSSAKMAKEVLKTHDLTFSGRPNLVQLFRPVREDEVYRMIKKISKSADASQPINLSEMMMSLTSTIMRYENEGGEKSRFNALHKETQVMLGSFFFADHFPFLGWVDKLTGMRRRLEKNFEE